MEENGEKEHSNQPPTNTSDPVTNLEEFLEGHKGDADDEGDDEFEFEVRGSA